MVFHIVSIFWDAETHTSMKVHFFNDFKFITFQLIKSFQIFDECLLTNFIICTTFAE